MKIKENMVFPIIQIKMMTPLHVAVCSRDEMFVDENNNYILRYRVDIFENYKCDCGNLIDCETGFKTMDDAARSAIEYLERIK